MFLNPNQAMSSLERWMPYVFAQGEWQVFLFSSSLVEPAWILYLNLVGKVASLKNTIIKTLSSDLKINKLPTWLLSSMSFFPFIVFNNRWNFGRFFWQKNSSQKKWQQNESKSWQNQTGLPFCFFSSFDEFICNLKNYTLQKRQH